MTVWCMAHPWMTFFIIISLITGVVEVAKAFNHIEDKEDEENTENNN